MLSDVNLCKRSHKTLIKKNEKNRVNFGFCEMKEKEAEPISLCGFCRLLIKFYVDMLRNYLLSKNRIALLLFR